MKGASRSLNVIPVKEISDSLKKAGVTVMVNELFETIKSAADKCEDACNQVRVMIVRR